MPLPGLIINKMKWRLKRLRCMSATEVSHRTITLLKNNLERLGFFTAKYPPLPELHKQSTYWFGRVKQESSIPYQQAAEKISRGVLDIFNLNEHYLGDPPEWNRDPLTGKDIPMVFGKTLDYRNEELVGDIKYVWEPSRHLQLVVLAQAYHLTGSEDYLLALRRQLTSWFDQCPYLMGPQWVSSLELGIRLINWYFIWQLIGGLESELFKGEEGKEFRDRWLQLIYQHVHFINSYYSRYSSANNHLIGEAAGVFIATTGWPFWPEFGKWQKKSARILESETLLQNTIDGVNREQAVAYQQFVLDFLLISKLTAEANLFEFSKDWVDRVESMLNFLASIMDVAGNIPMIGDADDGFVVSLSRGDSKWCPYRSLLATGAVVFNRDDFAVKSQYFDAKSKWLLGDDGANHFSSLAGVSGRLPVKRDFKEGGYYIIGDQFERRNEVRIIADAGALGYLNIAAHGHADALSFTLFVGGKEILIDTGTYTYHTQKKWRNYFRGTAAHNTVRVDRLDQSVIGGNFMWLRKATVAAVAWTTGEEEDSLVASHDGYARLSDPVYHKRTIRYNKRSRKLFVTDAIKCKSSHVVELFWHFGEHCQIDSQSGCIMIRDGSVAIVLKMVDPLIGNPEVVSGIDTPPLGWVSRRFGAKVPTTTVVYKREIHGDTEFCTEFTIQFIDSSESARDASIMSKMS